MHTTAYITARTGYGTTKTWIIETAPPQHLTLYLSPARTIQGRRLISAPLGRLSYTSPAVVLESQTRPNLDNIKCTYTVNFTQFCK